MGAYGKVGYLMVIVRFHIKRIHPKRHPTPYTNRGLHRLLTSGPHYCYVTRSCSPIALSIGLRLILMRAAQRSDCNSPTYCHHYITITPTCQVDYNVTTLYSLPSISSYRAGAAAALVM